VVHSLSPKVQDLASQHNHMLIDITRAGSQNLPTELAYKTVTLIRALIADAFESLALYAHLITPTFSKCSTQRRPNITM
jgi:hypothetical protein